MSLPEGYTIEYVDETDYLALLNNIDKDPVRSYDQEDVGRNLPLDDWEILLVAGSSQIDFNLIELRQYRHGIRSRYKALTKRADTGNRCQRITAAINFMLDRERKYVNVYTGTRGQLS